MKFNIEKSNLEKFIDALGRCGEVVSVFMKFAPTIMPAREFASPVPIDALLQHPEFKDDCAVLGKVGSKATHYANLNRMEFEGSLISVLIEGGCFRNSTPEHEARQLARDVLTAVFPEPFDDLRVFRLDDPSWSEFTDVATVSYSYVVWQASRGLWWMLSVADID